MNKEKLEFLMNYLKEQFPGCIDNHFTYGLIVNLIDYAYREHGNVKRRAAGIISCIIPEITYEELKMYLPDYDEWKPLENKKKCKKKNNGRNKMNYYLFCFDGNYRHEIEAKNLTDANRKFDKFVKDDKYNSVSLREKNWHIDRAIKSWSKEEGYVCWSDFR